MAIASVLDDLLAPFSTALFFEQYWDQQSLWISQRSPEFYRSFFSFQALKKLFEKRALNASDSFSILKNGKRLDREHYTQNDELDWVTLQALHDHGFSFVLNALHRYHPFIEQVLFYLSDAFQRLTNANLYLSPKSSQALTPHFDKHHVFVLQLKGLKHWHIYQNIQSIFPNQDPFELPPTVSSKYLSEPRVLRLMPGDLLYLPFGTVHEAMTPSTSPSLHLTIGMSHHLHKAPGDHLRSGDSGTHNHRPCS